MLTDHGYKSCGQLVSDYKIVQNAGGLLLGVRNVMAVACLDKPAVFQRPYQITISINSSAAPLRKRVRKQRTNASNSFSLQGRRGAVCEHGD
jgi:hypothetical protein